VKRYSIKRKFEETLSEGRGMQLLWLMIIIISVIVLFWAVVAFIFRDESLAWQDLLALFLDPGCFGGVGVHDGFRLVATLLGMFLFSALLISVVSNIFENIANSFKNGDSRYKHEGHILILGGGHQLSSMVYALIDEDSPYTQEDIVVLTTQSVDSLRTKIFSLPFLTKEKVKSLKKRMTFYYGERDNDNNLTNRELAKRAKVIYIIGEDGECDHDSISIRCCKKLQRICSETPSGLIKCFLILNDSSSVEVYKYITDVETSSGTNLRVDVIDSNQYLAEQVLVADHDGKDEVEYPKIDYRSIERDGCSFKQIVGLREGDTNYVHFVISGTSDIAMAMAMTAAHICHFPNYDAGKKRTVISFVDNDMKTKSDNIISSLPSLFKLSHYEFVSFDSSSIPNITKFVPNEEYGDFLDIEWQFIDADLNSPGMKALLEEWANDPEQSLSLAICNEVQKDNTFNALHLPSVIYSSGCPIFVYQQEYGDVLSLAKQTEQFGNIHTFGMASNIQDDPLFISRSKIGQRVNFIYNQAYGDKNGIKYDDPESAWYSIPEAHKYSSIYCANAMYMRGRSFGIEETLDIEKLTAVQRQSLYEVEHRRWMMSALLLGYSPVPTAERKEWKERRMSGDSGTAKAAKEEYKLLKSKHFIHLDITPFEDLIPSEQEKDKLLIDKLPYIMGK